MTSTSPVCCLVIAPTLDEVLLPGRLQFGQFRPDARWPGGVWLTVHEYLEVLQLEQIINSDVKVMCCFHGPSAIKPICRYLSRR